MNTKKPTRKSSTQTPPPLGPRWLLPTNHYNLMYWLAAGLVLPESAMDKYYADCLRETPGWLPLFRESVAQPALDAATSERGMAVLLNFDMETVSGTVQVITSVGELRACRFPDELPGDAMCILIPAPLPAQRIRQVNFLTKEARDDYQIRCQEFANVATLNPPLVVGKFPVATGFMDQTWLPEGSLPSFSPMPVHSVMREGAVLAAFHHLGNQGELSLAVAQMAFANRENSLLKNEAFRKTMNLALSHGAKREAADTRVRLYWGIVDHLMALTDDKVSLEQAVLDYLDQVAAIDPVSGPKLNELIQDLKQSLGLGGSTIRELFERHQGALAHALLLFFLRKHTDELFEFDTPGVSMTEADGLAAGILFALREDWMSTSPPLRNAMGLYPAITQRMATSLHNLIGSDIGLGGITPHPTLRELFSNSGGGPWTVRQHKAALELARSNKWKDAIETRVQLDTGIYRLEVTSRGTQIVLPGEVKAVTTEVQPARLLDYLTQLRWPVDANTEADVRATLDGKQG